MAKTQSRFICQNCGAEYRKWTGHCDACDSWNTIEEERIEAGPKATGGITSGARGKQLDFVALEGESSRPPRIITGITELDRACGGGLVPGSALLVGGDPGIGKSTILLQAVGVLAARHKCAYISGEEAVDQVRMRAARLGLEKSRVDFAAATSLRDIISTLDQSSHEVVVIDSIQTMYADTLDSAPGTVSQVRACALELIRLAKRKGFAVILVGHVTKEGQIAGPRVLEHMVDTVLYFEGERGHQFRILRAVKNRFGATDEIGVFEMGDAGLVEVPNPSALFLADRDAPVSGTAVFAGLEGTRPMLVEIQALVAQSALATPRRAVVGWDSARMNMILAVLDARCGLPLSQFDVYLNVAGGLRVGEPAADLAVASALISAVADVPVPAETVIVGEIGLSGEVRPVGQIEARLKEAAKLGFANGYVPRHGQNAKKKLTIKGLKQVEISHLQDLVNLFGQDVREKVRPREGMY
ncbi:DNA repair protein RadA [Thalassospira sp. TSL5-1]|uniref:DNA repair protein RadA n=1 Tax=Thalassospira sp. TSL5-1 TaxID=1544451 RepID=UPI00093EBEC8|nr:DNA repair protein RadA [Thalassospira sp. TSL5-1]OKH87060.1 DNA repair protein RadA [Thalassospira sp. TSL5-1]